MPPIFGKSLFQISTLGFIADEFVSQCNDNTLKKLFGKFEQLLEATYGPVILVMLLDTSTRYYVVHYTNAIQQHHVILDTVEIT